MAIQAYQRLSRINPIIVLVYGVLAILCIMAAFDPICVCIAFCASIALSFVLDGRKRTVKRLFWQLSVILIFALLNCVFTQRGATVIFDAGFFQLHFESLAYGACVALMIVSSMNYFIELSEVVSSDEALVLFGGKLAVISLVTSMSIRLVPKFQKQSRELSEIENACTCANLSFGKYVHAGASGRLTHLLAASLEDSLISADSMRARGWNSSKKRTTYGNVKMNRRSRITLVLVALFGAVCLFIGWSLSNGFQFYPHLTLGVDMDMVFSFSSARQALIFMLCAYSLYAIYFLLPFLALIVEVVKWKQ